MNFLIVFNTFFFLSKKKNLFIMPRNHPPEKENMQKENMQNFKDPVSLYGVVPQADVPDGLALPD